jgi:hypothetical protein
MWFKTAVQRLLMLPTSTQAAINEGNDMDLKTAYFCFHKK